MKIISLTTHPIQYHVPVFKALAADSELDFRALFLSDHSVKGGYDRGFGRAVSWDVPILEGYQHEFIENEGPGNAGKGFRAYRAKNLKNVFRKYNADVLLLPGHMVQAYWQAVRAAKSCGMAVVVKPDSFGGVGRERSLPKRLFRCLALKWFYGNADVICSTGHYTTEEARSMGFPDTDIVFAPYNIDSEMFEAQREKFSPMKNSTRAELGMAESDVGLVFCGKFIDWKNPDLILDALEHLPGDTRQSIFPIFIGDGINRKRIESRCCRILGANRFACPGFVNQSELGRYYSAGDIFVLPSKRGHESWGLVVNEAMTFGLPCLVSDGVGCRADLVLENKTGSVFKDGDAAALATLIEQLSVNADLRGSMGDAAYLHIQNYSTDEATKGLKKALCRAFDIKGKK